MELPSRSPLLKRPHVRSSDDILELSSMSGDPVAKQQKQNWRPTQTTRASKGYFGAWLRFWSGRWTAETFSCIFAIVALLGLVATLAAHEDKPLPQWPQIVNINSIISLFSLLIRAGVGVVLAEGMRPRSCTLHSVL
jgi:hypothetical protein